MTNSKWMAGVVGVILVITLVFTFGSDQEDSHLNCAVTLKRMVCPPSVEAKEPALAVKSSPYAMDIKPLTTAECAQCHFPVFETIKEKGARHQFDCVRCHREYHVYNPRKKNYDQIMPKCAWCHQSASGGAFHGQNKKLTPCLNCHEDPHKPLVIPMAKVETSCALCHTKESGEIQTYPSKHSTEVSCGDCHADKHGFIPECSVCHESHSPAVEMASKDCMTCHPVHKPTQTAYSKETPSTLCAGCHEDVYGLLQKKVTKHTAVTCADCHPRHGQIPLCARCHGEPHPKSMNATKCGDCHGVAHDLVM